MTSLLPRSSVAATVFVDRGGNNPHLRVYFQDVNGGIRESQYDGKWTGGNNVLVQARLDSPIAVTSWGNGNDVQIRLYFLSQDNLIHEHCFTGNKWIEGDLNKSKIKASPVSQLAAISFDGPDINVYFQKENRKIQELRHTNKWFLDKEFPEGMAGTNMAATLVHGHDGIRVYHQDPNTMVIEQAYNRGSGWTRGQFTAQAPANCGLAAIAWGKTGAYEIRVYISKADNLQEFAHSGQWNQGTTISNELIPGSNVAAVGWGEITDIRVYRLASNNVIMEQVWHNGWSQGSIVPTGNAPH